LQSLFPAVHLARFSLNKRIFPQGNGSEEKVCCTKSHEVFIDKAIRHLQEAIRIKPDYESAEHNLQEILKEQRQNRIPAHRGGLD